MKQLTSLRRAASTWFDPPTLLLNGSTLEPGMVVCGAESWCRGKPRQILPLPEPCLGPQLHPNHNSFRVHLYGSLIFKE